MSKHRNKLIWSFLFGGFEKHLEPLNIIKNYYGERYAFEYVYLLHYQAWLIIPGVLGIISTGFFLNTFRENHDFNAAKDNQYNAIFGLLTALWATIFVESWKRVQTRLCYVWNCSDGSFADKDEREEDFKYFNKLNAKTR